MNYGVLTVAVVCAVFFYRAGQTEKAPTALWTVISVLISFLLVAFTRWGCGVYSAVKSCYSSRLPFPGSGVKAIRRTSSGA